MSIIIDLLVNNIKKYCEISTIYECVVWIDAMFLGLSRFKQFFPDRRNRQK